MIINPPRLEPQECRSDPLFNPLTNEQAVGLTKIDSLEYLREGLEKARPVARVVKGNGERATGFLIEGNRLVTNNHVLPSAEVALGAHAQFNVEKDWQGKQLEISEFKFDPDAFFATDPGLDYTIAAVTDDDEGTLAKFRPLDTSTLPEPTVNDWVALIHHSGGRRKKISLTDNKVQAVDSHFVQYVADNCEVTDGASGTPVFNERWQLVALHSRGGPLCGGAGAQHWLNEGVIMRAVIDHAATATGEDPDDTGPPLSGDIPFPMDLYFHVFAELHPYVASLLTPAKPVFYEEELFSTINGTAHLKAPFKPWMKALKAKQDTVEAAVREGCACGVAFGAVVRPTGHESLDLPYASRGLPGRTERASDVYVAGHRRLERDKEIPAILAKLVKGIKPDEEGVVQAFVAGLLAGGDRGSRWAGPAWHPDDQVWPKRPR